VDTVCHIITKLELGGAQEVALYATSHLDRSKYRAVLIAGPGGLLTEEARQLSHVDVHIVPALARTIHFVGDIAALVNLIALFRRLRPQVVHTHSSKAGILGRWAAWFAGTPVIVHTIHGYGITPAQPLWLQQILILVERITGLVTTHWIAVSQADLDRGRSWGLFRHNVSLVRPGIDPASFLEGAGLSDTERIRLELGVGAGSRLVGTVACLKPQKAPEDFVAVAKRVVAVLPDVRFLLVGDGDMRASIETLIDRQGLRDHVYLVGWRRDVSAVMQALDVFLLTSHWEGLPRVLIEARAVGLPVVATNVGGAAEVVDHEQVGVLCRVGDIEGLATAVLRVLSNQAASANVKLKQRASLPREFHIDEMVTQYERLYERLLHARRNRMVPQATH